MSKVGRAGGIRTLLAGCAALAASAAAAQADVPRIAYFASEGPESKAYEQSFRAGLRELGYIEGRNLIVDVRLIDRDNTRIAAEFEAAMAFKPKVLVTWETGAQIMHARTRTVPIVIYGAVDPVKAGLADSLRRPGRNVTGISQMNYELPAKHIEIMREIRPEIRRIGQFVDEKASGCKLIEENARAAARRFGVELVSYSVSDGEDIEKAFSRIERERPDVLLPCPSAVMFNYRKLLFDNARRLRIPFTSFVVANVPDGVLFAYAADMHETRKRAAVYVDKVLKGANPAELPIEQPTNFHLVLNIKTAKALDIALPRSILVRADRVIE